MEVAFSLCRLPPVKGVSPRCALAAYFAVFTCAHRQDLLSAHGKALTQKRSHHGAPPAHEAGLPLMFLHLLKLVAPLRKNPMETEKTITTTRNSLTTFWHTCSVPEFSTETLSFSLLGVVLDA